MPTPLHVFAGWTAYHADQGLNMVVASRAGQSKRSSLDRPKVGSEPLGAELFVVVKKCTAQTTTRESWCWFPAPMQLRTPSDDYIDDGYPSFLPEGLGNLPAGLWN